MDTLHINLPATFKDFVDQRVSHEGYRSASEYVQALVEADQVRLARQEIESAILQGFESGDSAPMTVEDWQAIRAEVRSRYEQRNQKPVG